MTALVIALSAINGWVDSYLDAANILAKRQKSILTLRGKREASGFVSVAATYLKVLSRQSGSCRAHTELKPTRSGLKGSKHPPEFNLPLHLYGARGCVVG